MLSKIGLATIVVGCITLVSSRGNPSKSEEVQKGGGSVEKWISGGKEAKQGSWPWQVRLYSSMDDTVGYCGGSIIGPRWILTAAHCVEDESEVVVGYGSVDRTKTRKISGEKIVIHPDYLAGEKADLALIKLSNAIPDAQWIGIADAGVDRELLKPGAKVIVTGWGSKWDMDAFNARLRDLVGNPEEADVAAVRSATQKLARSMEDIQMPVLLHEVDLVVNDSSECKTAHEEIGFNKFTIGETEICAQGPDGIKDSCTGDSGGPLVVPAPNSRKFVQVGIVSWGLQCGNPLFPGVYTRVASFNDWIRETMGLREARP